VRQISSVLGSKGQAVIPGSVGVKPRFPEILDPTAGADAAQSQDIFRSGYAPEHARLFAPSADDRLAAGFDDPRANEETPATESSILHPFDIAHKVTQLFFHCLGLGLACTLPAGLFDERLNFVFEQSFGPAVMPGFVMTFLRYTDVLSPVRGYLMDGSG